MECPSSRIAAKLGKVRSVSDFEQDVSSEYADHLIIDKEVQIDL